MTSKIYIHLYHPCREIDVWEVPTDHEHIAKEQGYVSLDWLRELHHEYQKLRVKYDWLERATMGYPIPDMAKDTK